MSLILLVISNRLDKSTVSHLQVVKMSSVRLLMLSGPPPILQSPQGSPAVLARLDKVLVLLLHSSQKLFSMLIWEMYRSISLVVRGWTPRDVPVFMGRGSQKVWVPAGLDLHTCTTEVRMFFYLSFNFFFKKIELFRGKGD